MMAPCMPGLGHWNSVRALWRAMPACHSFMFLALEMPPLAPHHSTKKPYRQATMVSFKLTSLALAAFHTLGAVAQASEGVPVNSLSKHP